MRTSWATASALLACLLAGCGNDESSEEDPFAPSVTVDSLKSFALNFASATPIELDGSPLTDCAWSDDTALKKSLTEQGGSLAAEALECAGADGPVMSIQTFSDANAAEQAGLGELFPAFHYGELLVSGPPNRAQRDQFHASLRADCKCGQILHSGLDDSNSSGR